METAKCTTRKGKLPHYADGGLIGAIRRMVMPKGEAQKQSPPDKPTMAPMVRGSLDPKNALREREEAAGLKAGGAIRGKGGPTSDDIPIMASNGEFMIKAKAVKKIGIETLEALNAIADKPDEKDSKADRKAEGYKCGGAIKKMADGGYLAETDTSAADAQAKRELIARKVAAGQTAGAATMQGFNDIANMPLQGMKNGGAVRKMAMTGVPHMADAGLVDDAVKRAAQLSQSGGAVFGLYPQMTDTQHTTYATGNKLRAGVVATGPSTFQPAISNPSAPQAPIVGSGSGQRMDAATDPRVAAMQSAIPAAPAVPAVPAPSTNPVANMYEANQSANITRNGNSFSGTNVTGNQVSSLDTSAGYAADLKALADIEQKRQADVANIQAQERYAQDNVLQQRALGGNRNAAAILQGRTQDRTVQRGQDQQAQAQGAIQKLAQQKFGLESQTAGLDNASKVQMQAAQAKLLAAKTPEEKLAAEENLRALQGKYEKAAPPQKFTVINLPDTEGQSGRIGGGQAVIDANGQIVTQGNAAPALPPGMVKQIGTSGGKPVYLDKNGKQVIAKG